MRYSDKHLVCAELRTTFEAVQRTGLLPPAQGLPKPHLCDRSGELKLKRLRRC